MILPSPLRGGYAGTAGVGVSNAGLLVPHPKIARAIFDLPARGRYVAITWPRTPFRCNTGICHANVTPTRDEKNAERRPQAVIAKARCQHKVAHKKDGERQDHHVAHLARRHGAR